MAKKIKIDASKTPPEVLAGIRRAQAEDRKKNGIEEVHNTEEAIGYMLTGTQRRLRGLRKSGGDILALQALTYMFAGNPVALFAHQELAQESLACAESVRLWCLEVFRKYGGTGPEVMDRVIGPERNPLMAAHQALLRFTAFVQKAGEVMRDAPVPPVPEGHDAGEHARRIELIKKASETELTGEEHVELLALRDKFRTQMVAGGDAPAVPAPRPEEDDEAIEKAVDMAMDEPGALPPLPVGTTRERARELYLAAVKRALTPEERVEIGIGDEQSAAPAPESAERGQELMAKFGIKHDAVIVPVAIREDMNAVDGASVVAVGDAVPVKLETTPAMAQMAAAMAGAPESETPGVKRTTYSTDNIKL